MAVRRVSAGGRKGYAVGCVFLNGAKEVWLNRFDC